MDPNETLRLIRNYTHSYYSGDVATADLAELMFSHFEALDNWLTNGGFLPRDWVGGPDV